MRETCVLTEQGENCLYNLTRALNSFENAEVATHRRGTRLLDRDDAAHRRVEFPTKSGHGVNDYPVFAWLFPIRVLRA